MSEPKEYIVKNIKKGDEWNNSFGTFQSYSMALEGISEPVSMNKKTPVTNEPQAGDTLYGTLESMMSRNGKAYNKFKSEQRPPSEAGKQGGYQPKDVESIYRCNSLNNSVAFIAGSGSYSPNSTQLALDIAEQFYTWLKAGKPATEPIQASDDKARDWENLGKQREAEQAHDEGTLEDLNAVFPIL